MRAINHALTGAFIGLVVGEPVIAVPAAVASHFVCDAIPHYDGVQRGVKNKQKWMRSRVFHSLLYTDVALCVGLVGLLALRQPLNWQLAAICAFCAAAPDFLSFNMYQRRHAKQQPPLRGFNKFAGNIQWFQRPIGWVVEAAWFTAGIVVLTPFLR